jgi:hypothetical protein
VCLQSRGGWAGRRVSRVDDSGVVVVVGILFGGGRVNVLRVAW